MNKVLYLVIFVCFYLGIPLLALEFPNKEHLLKIIENKAYPNWMLEQIEEDLASFSEEDFSEQILDDFIEQLPSSYGVYRIKIVNGRVDFSTKVTHSFHRERFDFMGEAFSWFMREIPLPDIDLICCLNDAWDLGMTSVPVLVFAKNKKENHVLIPDFEIIKGYGKINHAIDEAVSKYPWVKKKEVAFWRGSTSGGDFSKRKWRNFPRSRLVFLSLHHPQQIDARFTNLCQGAENNREIVAMRKLMGKIVSQGESLRYKYLVDVDGNSCGYERPYWTLLSNCVVLKQTSDNIQWYYRILKPYKHYIPIANDCSDLLEKIEWAKSHDAEAKQIADRGTQLVRENLQIEHAYAYLYLLLTTYAERQKVSR